MTNLFDVAELSVSLDEAADKLDLATGKTGEAREALAAIPTKGWASWGRGEDLKKANTALTAALAEEEVARKAYTQASEDYQLALDIQEATTIAVEKAAAEADELARKEVLGAAALILDTAAVDKVGKAALHKIAVKEGVVERAERAIREQKERLEAARILGYNA